MKSKKNILIVYAVWYCLYAVACNIANAVTPAIIKSINIPDYMFGISYATMSFFAFLTSSLWGKLSDHIGRYSVLIITLCGASLGQFLFSRCFDVWSLVLARMVTGIFAGGHIAVSFAYFLDIGSKRQQQGKIMAISATLSSVFSACGYLVGGVIGDISLKYTFTVQITMLLSLAFILAVFVGESPKVPSSSSLIQLKEAFFVKDRQKNAFISADLKIIFIIQFLACIGANAFDQAFNYYLAASLNLPPSYNGYVKAAVAIIGLVSNFTITMKIIKKGNLPFAQSLIYASGACVLYIILMVSSIPVFFTIALLFFLFSNMQNTILQVMASNEMEEKDAGYLLGKYNGYRNLGNLAGALISGFAYAKNDKLPFLLGAVAFTLVALLSFWTFLRKRKELSII